MCTIGQVSGYAEQWRPALWWPHKQTPHWVAVRAACLLPFRISLWLGHCQLQLIIGYTTYWFGFWITWIHPYSAKWTINFQGQREQPQNNYHLCIQPIFILCQPSLYSSTVLGWGNTDEWGLVIILKEFIVLMHSQICKQIITSCFKTLILQGTLQVLKDHREETDYQST